MSDYFGDIDKAPSIIANPFDASKVEHIRVWMSKRLMGDGFYIKGVVEFRNGNTGGQQNFTGESLMDVLQQIYTFLETLK